LIKKKENRNCQKERGKDKKTVLGGLRQTGEKRGRIVKKSEQIRGNQVG